MPRATKWVEAENIVSNGPFKMTEWTHDQKIMLERNDSYYGEKPTTHQGDLHALRRSDCARPTLLTRTMSSTTARRVVRTSSESTPTRPKNAELVRFQRSNCYFVVCDCSNPPTDKVEFRQALSKAINRETLSKTILKGEYEAAYTVLPNNIPGHNPDVGHARGCRRGQGPAATRPESTPARSHSTSSSSTSRSTRRSPSTCRAPGRTTSASRSSCRRSRTAPTATGAHHARRSIRHLHRILGLRLRRRLQLVQPELHQLGRPLPQPLDNTDFDALVAKAVANTNTEERDQQYGQAEVMLVDQAPVIPILHAKAVPRGEAVRKGPLLPADDSRMSHLRTIKIAAH